MLKTTNKKSVVKKTAGSKRRNTTSSKKNSKNSNTKTLSKAKSIKKSTKSVKNPKQSIKRSTTTTSLKNKNMKSSNSKKINKENEFKIKKTSKIIKKNSLIIILFIILISSIGVAYAYFHITTSNDDSLARINASLECLDISFSEENTISLQNQYPITDEYALANLTPVEVTVTNNCANVGNVNYTLALTTLKNSTGYISDNAIKTNMKINLNNTGDKVLKSSNYLTSLNKIEDGSLYNYLINNLNEREDTKNYIEKTIYKIDSASLSTGKVNKYKIYLWIDYYEGDTTQSGLNNNTTMGLDFKSAISLVINGTEEGLYAINYHRNGLPDGYQEVEYIESTRSQRINTGYIPPKNTKLEIELSFNGTFKYGSSSDTGGTASFLDSPYTSEFDAFTINFGAASDQGNVIFPWFDKSYDSGAEIQRFTITDAIRTNRNTLTIEPGKVSYGTVSRTITRKTADQEDELYVFGNSTLAFNRYNMRVYKMTISEDGDIKGIYVPCYRINDGAIGLYDVINDAFKENIGTGTFNKGSDVNGPITSGTMKSLKSADNTFVTLDENKFTREGYAFVGWNTKPDGSGINYSDGQTIELLEGDLDLYAMWVKAYNITITSGHGISNVSLDGWNNTGTSTMSKELPIGYELDLDTIELGYKNGYQGKKYTANNGTVSKNNVFTVGEENDTITIDSTSLITPTISITGGPKRVYGNGTTTLTCQNKTTYDSSVKATYSFGYASSYSGTPSNWTSPSSSPYYSVPKEFKGYRYYSCRINLSDDVFESTKTTSPSSNAIVEYVNSRINFNSGSGTLIGSSTRYVAYNDSSLFISKHSTAPLADEGYVLNNINNYSVEDEITLNNENFYIIEINGSDVTVVTKYLLNTSSVAQSQTSPSASMFATSGYWNNNIGEGNEYPGSYNSVPRPYVYNSNSSLYTHINKYADKVASAIGSNVTGRLLSYEEATTLSKSVVATTHAYWSGSACSNSSICHISTSATIGNNVIYSGSRIRPVLKFNNTVYAIPKAQKEGYTFNGWWTQASGGNQVISPTGEIKNVNGWTKNGNWALVSTTDNTSVNNLYAQFIEN